MAAACSSKPTTTSKSPFCRAIQVLSAAAASPDSGAVAWPCVGSGVAQMPVFVGV